jgi:hypothetical protein
LDDWFRKEMGQYPLIGVNISMVINKGNKYGLPSGKHTKNYGKSPSLMGKSTN